MRRGLHLCATTIAVTALLASASCSGSDKPKKTPSNTPTPTTSSATTTTPAPKPAAPAKNPFTGIGGVPTTPVISVKIDDTAAGRPQVGIDKADIVYVEAVEGGLTRLAAIFGTYKPSYVGYVRSTRPSDPDLLLQFGKITAAYSGGAHDSLPRMHRSGLKSWSNDAGAAYYSRRSHPGDHGYINLVLDLSKVAKKAKTNRPKSIGWTFSPTLAGLTARTGNAVRTVVNQTPVEFRYYPSLRKYIRFINGVPQRAADGKLIAATNVIVQFCRIVPHPQDTDVMGNPSQFTYTVGRGKLAVFRQGKRIDGVWSRAKLDAGTSLRTSTGKPIPLAPGNSWVLLAKNGAPLSG